MGGDKCGSTWIHHILSRHPEVTLASAKELFYFDRFYDRGADWYNRQYPNALNARRVGEICHDYLYSEDALKRIAQDMSPDSKFLITVRDPIDRTISHYKYLRKIGRTTDDLETALRTQPQIIEHSMFGKHVANACKHLGSERVTVLPFELLREDAEEFGRSLCEALDVTFVPDLPYNDKVLEAQAARSPAAVRVLRDLGWVVRRLGFPSLVSHVKSQPIVSRILFSSDQRQVAGSVVLNEDARHRLEAKFVEDQKLLSRSFPKMKDPS